MHLENLLKFSKLGGNEMLAIAYGGEKKMSWGLGNN